MTDPDGYHVPISDATIASHYERVRGVYERLATVGEYPTMGLDDLSGWYITRDEIDLEPIEEGYTKRRRPASFEKDLDTVLERVDRTIYGLTTYKSPAAFCRWTSARKTDTGEYEHRGGDNPTPDPDDLRAVSVWGDIDLCDDLKGQRGDLDDDTRATAEATLEAYAAEFAKLVGGTDAVYALDSVGGAYIFTAPEATIPIAQYVREEHGEDWVGDVLRAVIDRSNEWLKDAQERVEARVDGAGDVIDPDWANNHNRKYKAPLSIHKDHDAVVTPLDPDDVDYSITRLDDVDDDLVAEAEAWASRYTATDHTDRAGRLVELLFDESDDAETWRDAIDTFVERRREETEKRERLQEAREDRDDDRERDLSEFDITPRVDDVEEAIDNLDIYDVADDTIVDHWTERKSGLTDRSGSGKKAIVPTWAGGYNSGNATYVDERKGIFNDTDSGDHGTAVEMALLDLGGWRVGDIADGEDWARGVAHLRDLGYDIPIWTPDAETTPDGDKMPYWALRRAAIALGVIDEADLVKRDSETGGVVEDPDTHDGDTYDGFPPRAYAEAIAAVEAAGLETGREPVEDHQEGHDADEEDPRDLDVVLDPGKAWDAAGRVEPADLPDDAPELSLPTTADGQGWRDPATDTRVDVVRAVAIDEDLIADPTAALEGDTYDRAYRRAREKYDAPLPRFMGPADATERWDLVQGAIRELSLWHFDPESIRSTVTGQGDEVAGDAVRTFDPAWRDSESGESVVAFNSGVVYDHDTNDTIDPLRFVALEHDLIYSPQDPLEGERFRTAYRLAREEYDAPLPKWVIGDPDHTPVLPPADDLVDGIYDSDADRLARARDDVENLYRDLAGDPETSAVLTALPATGKTTAGIKTADERPTTYLSPRKELMQQAAEKARRFGADAMHLPVFADDGPRAEATDQAVAHVREHGMDRLRDRWALVEAVDGAIGVGDDVEPTDDAGDDSDDVTLDRPSCPTANGAHGAAWALAVHTARELDYHPRDIHERAHALFGAALPCQEDGDCAYSQGWDRATDPDAPVDLLIGHYGHAYVQGARTHYRRGPDGETIETPRTLVVDEFPGFDTFGDEFGPEFMDHATWLARALRADIQDRQDLFEADLWDDDWVRAWLDGDGADHPATDDAVAHLDAVATATDIVTEATDVIDGYRSLLEAHDLLDPLQQLTDSWPAWGRTTLDDVVATLDERVGAIPHTADGWPVVNWIRRDILQPLRDCPPIADAEGPALDAAPFGGDLAEFVRSALDAAETLADTAGDMLAAARTALAGGRAGARELAVHADDGYAHRTAHLLLYAVIAPSDGDGAVDRIETPSFAYGGEEGATLTRVTRPRQNDDADDTVLVDRDHKGATVYHPPRFRAGDGAANPVIGLDATGRRRLWSLALGLDVDAADIHDSRRERRAFLRDVLNLQVVQTTDRIKSYEGSTTGRRFADDIALVEAIADEFTGVVPGDRDSAPITVGDPAVITTKCVRDELEERLDDSVSAWDNYGNVTGANDLGEHRLAAILGSQHYGDRVVEKVAALAGEECHRSGHGHALDYDSETANVVLDHMREDQTLQAILRFTRDEGGAIVFAHTAALRDDLPVVGRGEVVRTFSDAATGVARAARRHQGDRFTIGDVADAVDVGRRQVRRILDDLADLGYLEKHDTKTGLANEFESGEDPGRGEVNLPRDAIEPAVTPDEATIVESYTWNVRVHGGRTACSSRTHTGRTILNAPAGRSGGGSTSHAAD